MNTIEKFLYAGAPIFFIHSCETDIVENSIWDAALKVDPTYQIIIWKSTTGIRQGQVKDRTTLQAQRAGDIVVGLKQIIENNQACVAIFHNVREYIRNPMIVQYVIDAAEAAKQNGSHVIFIGAALDLPPELTHMVMLVEFPLPTRSEIEECYKRILAAYKDEIQLPEDANKMKLLLRRAANSAVGLPLCVAENALAISLVSSGKIDLQIIQAQKEQEIKKSDCLEFISDVTHMNDVGGFVEFKKWMQRRRRVYTDAARKFGLNYPKGILVVGIAGSGKSLVAKATASYLGLPLIRLDIGKIFKSLVGESEKTIRMALKTVEAVAPVVLFIDEIDKGLAGGSGSGVNDSGVTSRVIATLLTWRQETKYPVMLVATANCISTLPAAIYRKGRIDEIWATDFPTFEERVEILSIHLRKRGRDPLKYGLKQLAKACNNFVGSEIESCIEEALFYAFDENKELQDAHIKRAILETIPQFKRDAGEIEHIREWVSNNARYVGVPLEKSEIEPRKINLKGNKLCQEARQS